MGVCPGGQHERQMTSGAVSDNGCPVRVHQAWRRCPCCRLASAAAASIITAEPYPLHICESGPAITHCFSEDALASGRPATVLDVERRHALACKVRAQP